MVTRIHKEKTGMTLAEFKKNAGVFYPYVSKVFYIKKKPVAKYSGKTKRVSLVKKRK